MEKNLLLIIKKKWGNYFPTYCHNFRNARKNKSKGVECSGSATDFQSGDPGSIPSTYNCWVVLRGPN